MRETAAALETFARRLMNEQGDYITRLCFLYLGDEMEAQDAAQESFLKALRAFTDFRGESAERTWLARIAINTCKDILRSPWRKRVDGEQALLNLPDSEDGPEAFDDTVLLSVLNLPAKYKDVILLYYYQDLSLKDIARTLGLPLPTVSSRLIRARKRLSGQLKGWYLNEED